MKIDSSLFTDTQNKDIQKLQPLVSWLNSFVGQVITIFRNRVGFEDNIHGEKLTITKAMHGQQQITNIRAPVLGVLAFGVRHPTDALVGVAWRIDNDGRLVITPYFYEGSSESRSVTLYVIRS